MGEEENSGGKNFLNLNIIEIDNKNSTILDPNQQLTLNAIVLPANAANQAIMWTSSSTTYATVTSIGATAASVTGVREREERKRPHCFVCMFCFTRRRSSPPRGASLPLHGGWKNENENWKIGRRRRERSLFLPPQLVFFFKLPQQHQGATGGGSSTITVTTTDGSFTASITIWINLITFTPSVASVAVLGTQQMSWTVYPTRNVSFSIVTGSPAQAQVSSPGGVVQGLYYDVSLSSLVWGERGGKMGRFRCERGEGGGGQRRRRARDERVSSFSYSCY